MINISTMHRHNQGEAGIVSIMVTMITMIVISLIVLGFADIARTEQRNSLDDQLSAQAYYAAESGINDARAAISGLIANGQPVTDKTTCGNPGGGSYNFTNVIDASHNVSYPCLLISTSLQSLSYNVGYTSTVIPLFSDSGSFGTLTLSWGPAGQTAVNLNQCPNNWGTLGQFLPASGWGAWTCNFPVIRVDMVDANGGFARSNWNDITMTDFLVPVENGPNNPARMSDRGSVVGAHCTAASGLCTVKINGLGGKKYFMRVTTLYKTNSLLTITTNGGGKFVGSQAVIDSTGKAQDVLRRIVVAVDLTDANSRVTPSNALDVEDSICKRFGVTNSSFDVYETYGNGGEGNPLCNKYP